MSIVLASLVVLVIAGLVNVFLVPQVLRASAGAGVVMSGGGQFDGEAIPAFTGMIAVLLGWAYLCFTGADLLAGEDFGHRWVLLLAAAGLAGAPYSLYQRRVRSSIAHQLVPPLHEALQYAGGLQSLVVLFGMISGAYFDWWEYLPS